MNLKLHKKKRWSLPWIVFKILRKMLPRKSQSRIKSNLCQLNGKHLSTFLETSFCNCPCRDAAKENIVFPKWQIAGGSVIGSSHYLAGRKCEDTAGWISVNDHLLVAISDGAGSAKYARQASNLAVSTILQCGLEIFMTSPPFTGSNARDILTYSFLQAKRKIFEEALKLRAAPSDLACTLLFVMGTPTCLAAAQIGDGAIVIGDKETKLTTLKQPVKGEFINETEFLFDTTSIDISIINSSELPFQSIAMFTDGIEHLALELPVGNPHPGFFKPLFSDLKAKSQADAMHSIYQFLNSPPVLTRTNDDKTLVVAQLQ